MKDSVYTKHKDLNNNYKKNSGPTFVHLISKLPFFISSTKKNPPPQKKK